MPTFYRVCDPEKEQGLWYDPEGNFTGIVHGLDYLRVQQLRMDYDPEVVGWLSCTDSLDKLWAWFSKEEILRLQERGLYIHEYTSKDFKHYKQFDHMLIKQDTARVIRKIVL